MSVSMYVVAFPCVLFACVCLCMVLFIVFHMCSGSFVDWCVSYVVIYVVAFRYALDVCLCIVLFIVFHMGSCSVRPYAAEHRSFVLPLKGSSARHKSLSLSLSLYLYIYVYIYIYMYMYISLSLYIYIYIYPPINTFSI